MNDQQLLRYSRHILIDEIGIEGQEKLLAGRVLIVGVGGLGCPASLYLASAGVGHLSLADDDIVDLSNLQRQILHTESRLGQTKTESARTALKAINPDVCIQTLPRLDENRLQTIIQNMDVVLDCSDNFATRYAINRACLTAKKPLVSGAAIKLSGQLFCMDPRQPDAPCYACLYPESGIDDALRCATTGILAPLTGVIGALQALEAIKFLTGLGAPLQGLQRYDALSGTWRQSKLQKDPDCFCHSTT